MSQISPCRAILRMAASIATLMIAALSGNCVLAADLANTPSAEFLGAKIFADDSLSASGKMSCASCHDPAHAHAQSNSLAVQVGGAGLDVPGFRSVPSLRYLNMDIAFFFDREGTPTGGLNRDGRAANLIEQAQRPFLAPHEMANASVEDFVRRLEAASYAETFRARFGVQIFDDAAAAFLAARFALAQFQLHSPEFRPFDSKYDLFLRGKQRLSVQELRGLAWFNRPDKGNCSGCHSSARGSDGSLPLFTDYTYDNLGVPRNPAIAANADPAYADFGLCDRTDQAERSDLCGAFKVPTLRNVATRKVFFHNGRYSSLGDVLRFYVRRDTNPEEFYPVGDDGVVRKFDDLPPSLQINVNTQEVPYDRHPGQSSRLSANEIDDVIAFLKSLTDGYDPVTDSANPARSLSLITNP
ncbi:MAG: cytochrome c peroxidase [Tahibacter sp.]